ncbi:hypothetical protein Fmac_015771 [Flemingia macrophylla]|uniref:Uncharacterized protein n=1 Tax=Flemingia macrophylla TaxID=520843 RepID=A0ABD1MFH3_9FABA
MEQMEDGASKNDDDGEASNSQNAFSGGLLTLLVTLLASEIPAAPHYDTSHSDTSRNLLVGQNPAPVRTLHRSEPSVEGHPSLNFPTSSTLNCGVCSGCHMPTNFRLVRPRTTPYWVRGSALIPFVTPLASDIPATPHYDTSHGDTSRNLLVGQNPSPVRTLRRFQRNGLHKRDKGFDGRGFVSCVVVEQSLRVHLSEGGTWF